MIRWTGRFDLYFQVEWLKLLQFEFYSRTFGYVGDPSQMRRGPTGTDRRPLSVTTGDYVAGKSAGYEKQALPLIRRIFPRSFTFCLKHDIRLHVKKINGAKQNSLIGSSYWVVRCVEHSLYIAFLCTPLKFSWSLKRSLRRRPVTICDGVKSFNFKQAVLKALLKGQARGIGYTGYDL